MSTRANPDWDVAALARLSGSLSSRALTVPLSSWIERRVVAHMRALNGDFLLSNDELLILSSDADIAIVLLACADRGLEASERERGVWAELDGRERPLPRPRRAPWRRRVKYSWREAVLAWRST